MVRNSVLATLCVVASAWGQAGEEAPLFRSAVSNVKIDVQVTQKGQLVRDLTLPDFLLFDQSRPRALLHVDHGAEPLSLLLLLDVSGSMKKHVQEMAGVARDALRFLKAKDRVAVMVFATTSKLRKGFTENLADVEAEIQAAVEDESPGNETAMNRAILDSAQYMEAEGGDSRRAILILTDNLGHNVNAPDERVVQALYAANTVLDGIVVGTAQRPGKGPSRHARNPEVTYPNVYYIAEETGGEAVKSLDASAAFPQMVERIRTRYSLHYKTPPGVGGEFRNVRVELSPAAKLR